MANYQLYIWEPEVDLTIAEWNKYSQEDEDTVWIIAQHILTPNQDKISTKARIVVFFEYMAKVIHDPQYAGHFISLRDQILKDLERVKEQPYLAYYFEGYSFSQRNDEAIKRLLYEAIEHAGLCAFSNRDFHMIISEPISRQMVLSEVFNHYELSPSPMEVYPALTDFDQVPECASHLVDLVQLFMQQDPVGKNYQLVKREGDINKYSDCDEAFESLIYQSNRQQFLHQINFTVLHDLEKQQYELKIYSLEDNWYFLPEALDMLQRQQIFNEKATIMLDQHTELWKFHLKFGFVADPSKWDFKTQMSLDELSESKTFFSEVSHQLDAIKHIETIEDAITFAFRSDFMESNRIIDILMSQYKLLLFSGYDPAKKMQIEHRLRDLKDERKGLLDDIDHLNKVYQLLDQMAKTDTDTKA